jgi:hypothetical protein
MTMEPVRYRDSTCDSRWREPRYGEVKDSLFTHLLMGCVSGHACVGVCRMLVLYATHQGGGQKDSASSSDCS